jgi:cephalosporin-C deacetylase
MPLVDMPLEQLKRYKPRLTRRKDFDAFWSRTLRAALAQPLNAALEPYAYPARGVRVRRASFDGFENGRIAGWLLEPESPGRHPAVVVYHGYSGRSPGVFQLLPWAGQGFVVLSVDCRGQNGSSTDGMVYPEGHRPGFMTAGILDKNAYYYRYVYADGVRALEVAASLETVDADRIGVLGGSQGGGLSLAAAALAPKRVKLAAPAVPFLCHYERAVDMAENPYREIGEYIKAWPQRRDHVFETLSYFDTMNLADHIRGRVLVSVGLWDLICPPSTVFAVYNHMKCRKEIAVYACTGHEENDDWRERVFALMASGLRDGR